MVVEGRDFVHLGHRELHLSRERNQMSRREAAEAILNFVKMFDEEIAPPRCVAEQRGDVFARFRVDTPSLRRGAHARFLALGHPLILSRPP
jgi:hypothetical protein